MRLGTVFSREGGQLPGFGPSRRRKCKQPPASPATMRSAMKAQHSAALSQVKVAVTSPVPRSHTFSVWSQEAETARRPSPLTATP